MKNAIRVKRNLQRHSQAIKKILLNHKSQEGERLGEVEGRGREADTGELMRCVSEQLEAIRKASWKWVYLHRD